MLNNPRILVVSPASSASNNGNWQTAYRWAQFLRARYHVEIAGQWDSASPPPDALIALHARRSADSIQAYAKTGRPLVVVLTGTDLYRDIASDATAQASLAAADRLIVLNELGTRSLPGAVRAKARVLLQSCAERRPLAKTATHLRALMVGHLREEKSPRTYFEAARLLAPRPDILLDHVSAALDPMLGAEAAALMRTCPRYRWLGGVPHAAARRRIQAAHVLVHASRMEGGAHVVIEAVRSGTAVLASHIDGNVGLLGEDYAGYFPVGDAAALAAILQRVRDEPALLARLQFQCAARAALFDPAREAACLKSVVREILDGAEADLRGP